MTPTPCSPSSSAQPTHPSAVQALEANLPLIRRAVQSVPMPAQCRDDAYQEAAAVFLARYASYDADRGTVSTFMWPHLRGAALHFVRGEVRHATARSTDDDAVLDVRTTDEPTCLDVDVERFLRGLSSADRTLVVRIFWDDENLSEVARSLGVARQTLHVRYQRVLTEARNVISLVAA